MIAKRVSVLQRVVRLVRGDGAPLRSLHHRDGSYIGFIGLGTMGAPMAMNLTKFGHRLVVHDVDSSRAQEYVCNLKVAEMARIVFTMLPDSSSVEEAYLDCLIAGTSPRSVFVDSSTIHPATAKHIAKRLDSAQPGTVFSDAPVSGDVARAIEGTLNFMVGCRGEDLRYFSSLLRCMGRNVARCGDVGHGQTAKICNNLILGVTMAGVCEAMKLASVLGMDAQALTNVVNSSSGRSWSSESYNPVPHVLDDVPASREYENGFKCDLMVKDLSIAMSEGLDRRLLLPVGSTALSLYKKMSDDGHGLKDFSGLYKYFAGYEVADRKPTPTKRVKKKEQLFDAGS